MKYMKLKGEIFFLYIYIINFILGVNIFNDLLYIFLDILDKFVYACVYFIFIF